MRDTYVGYNRLRPGNTNKHLWLFSDSSHFKTQSKYGCVELQTLLYVFKQIRD